MATPITSKKKLSQTKTSLLTYCYHNMVFKSLSDLLVWVIIGVVVTAERYFGVRYQQFQKRFNLVRLDEELENVCYAEFNENTEYNHIEKFSQRKIC